MRGRLHHVILDCPDPRALARFYSALLNHPITYASDDFVVVAANDTTSGLAFQLAPDHRAPTWPNGGYRAGIVTGSVPGSRRWMSTLYGLDLES